MSGGNGLVQHLNSKGKEEKKRGGKGAALRDYAELECTTKSTEAQNHRRPWKIELLCHKSGNVMQGGDILICELIPLTPKYTLTCTC